MVVCQNAQSTIIVILHYSADPTLNEISPAMRCDNIQYKNGSSQLSDKDFLKSSQYCKDSAASDMSSKGTSKEILVMEV